MCVCQIRKVLLILMIVVLPNTHQERFGGNLLQKGIQQVQLAMNIANRIDKHTVRNAGFCSALGFVFLHVFWSLPRFKVHLPPSAGDFGVKNPAIAVR